MNRLFLALIFIAMLSVIRPALAWDGYDYEKGSSVEIEKGSLVREGEDIEYFDYDEGEYRAGEVQSVDRFGSSVEIEVQDDESGETRTLDMDD